jgi:hypothetical protein
MDEMDVLATVDKMSALIGRPLVIHKDLYKLLLGVAMMGNHKTILGPQFTDPSAIRAIEHKVLMRFMGDAMFTTALDSILTPSLEQPSS